MSADPPQQRREEPSHPGESEQDDLLAQLKAHYLAGSAARLAGVDKVLAASRAAPADTAAGEALYRLLHTLAGSAGTYGFTQISVDARALEREVMLAREQGPIPAELLQAVAEFRKGMAVNFVEAGAQLEPEVPARMARPPSGDREAASAFAQQGLAGPDDAFDQAPGSPAAGQRRDPGSSPESGEVPARRLVRRLILSIVDGGEPSPQLAADGGTAAALAGTHLVTSGPSPAVRAYRAAGGDGQVLSFLDAPTPPETAPTDGSAPDLPLPCGTRTVRNAMLAICCDAALLCSEVPQAILDAKAVLRAGRPLAVAAPSDALRKAIGAPAHLLHEGPTLQHAVLSLLLALAPGRREPSPEG
jgi:HPt (histidine-containing phosphotransfer) domain-containing protein